ncbi:MAG: lamin tail domain-containing protein [bacterium]|nr:lamin tail domain-containing protein [bacterium]
MRLSELFIALIFALSPLQLQAVVVLSEVMFDPGGEESSDEFVELYNDAALPVQLAGWTISDGEGTDTLVSTGQGLTATPRQYILILDPDYIEDGSVTYDGLVPENALIVTISNGTFGSRGLSNSSGEIVSIQNMGGNLISEYRYSVGNESGHSDEKVRLNLGNDTTNWHNSIALQGTPGFRNSVTPPDRDLGVISLQANPEYPSIGGIYHFEILIKNFGLQSLSSNITVNADSIGFGQFYQLQSEVLNAVSAGDCTSVVDSIVMPQTGIQQIRAEIELVDDDSSNNVMTVLVSSQALEAGLRINEIQYAPITGRAEWVELAVAGTLPVSTRGMKITDGQGIADTMVRVQLPDWVIQPGEFVIISADSTIFLEVIPLVTQVAVLSTSVITLNNNGDSIAVFTPNGEMLDRVDYRANWGNDELGVSLERVSFDSPQITKAIGVQAWTSMARHRDA